MQDKVIVITGATSGIGLAAARQLAAEGARLILVGRDAERTAAAVASLEHSASGAHRGLCADLSSLRATADVAAAIAASEPILHVLANNAGAMCSHRQVSADGLEMTFALNHMSYFMMLEGLKERLAAAPHGRVVNTSSGAHRGIQLRFDDLQSTRFYSGSAAYARSKLCNVLFTREAARRLAPQGITVNAFHPGFVASRFGDDAGGMVGAMFPFFKRAAIAPERGADTLTYLATAPEVEKTTGGYFYRRRRTEPSAAAKDDTAAGMLWAESERIAARVTS